MPIRFVTVVVVEVRQLVAALTAKVQEFEKLRDAQAVGNALYGLQKMGESQEVGQLVAALTKSWIEYEIELEGGKF